MGSTILNRAQIDQLDESDAIFTNKSLLQAIAMENVYLKTEAFGNHGKSLGSCDVPILENLPNKSVVMRIQFYKDFLKHQVWFMACMTQKKLLFRSHNSIPTRVVQTDGQKQVTYKRDEKTGEIVITEKLGFC